jgi:hypothetical protein
VKPRPLHIAVGVVAAGAIAGGGLYAFADSGALKPREQVFERLAACGPNEERLNAIAEIAAPDAEERVTRQSALTFFLRRSYPGAVRDNREILFAEEDMSRFGISSRRGLELIVDVANTENGFVVEGWSGCNSYLMDSRGER